MNTTRFPAAASPSLQLKLAAVRQSRIALEAAGIAEARADIAAGRVVDGAEVDAWIDSLDTERELPIPFSGR